MLTTACGQPVPAYNTAPVFRTSLGHARLTTEVMERDGLVTSWVRLRQGLQALADYASGLHRHAGKGLTGCGAGEAGRRGLRLVINVGRPRSAGCRRHPSGCRGDELVQRRRR